MFWFEKKIFLVYLYNIRKVEEYYFDQEKQFLVLEKMKKKKHKRDSIWWENIKKGQYKCLQKFDVMMGKSVWGMKDEKGWMVFGVWVKILCDKLIESDNVLISYLMKSTPCTRVCLVSWNWVEMTSQVCVKILLWRVLMFDLGLFSLILVICCDYWEVIQTFAVDNG